jgi:hypothetical protein
MITGASHSLHSNLAESLNYYRQQLEQQKINQPAIPKGGEASTLPTPVEPSQLPTPVEPSQLPAPVEPDPPKSYEVEGELNQIPLSEQIKQAAEERRDIARAAAVSVESLQHKQAVINTYMNAASDSSETSANSENKVSPSEVYQETLDYQKREDLMAALQQASNPEQLGKIIDITV